MKKVMKTFYASVPSMIKNQGPRIAAEGSYYLMFSISPALFLIVVAVSHLAASPLKPHWFEQFAEMASAFIPGPTFEMFSDQLQQITANSNAGVVFLAVVVFCWTFTKIFNCYMDGISRAYEIPDHRSYLKVLMISLGLALASGVLLFLTTLLFVLLPFVFRWLNRVASVPGEVAIMNLIRYVGTFLLLIPSITLLYKYGPDGRDGRTHRIWPGAGVAALLWIGSTQLFGVYLEYSDAYQVPSGALGGVIILLLWMYISSLAIVFGAEFNANLQKNFKS